MLTLVIILAGLTQLFVSLFVFLRGRNNLSNFFFFLIGITSLGWALCNYFAISYLDSPNLIVLVRFILFFVVLQNASFYLFARTFPSPRWQHSRKWLAAYLLFTVVTAAATLSLYVFTSVTIDDGLPVTQAGPGILIFIIHASLSIGVAFKVLISKMRKSVGQQRSQLQVLLFASVLIWVVVPITNFVITPLTKSTLFIVAAPIYTLAFASIIAYAIVAQRLFDIKATVARSVTYLFVIVTLGLMYAALLFGISELILSQSSFDQAWIKQLTYIVLGVFLAFTFQPIKSFFNRLTNKLFYTDTYDTQELLNELNKVLVSTIEIETLLTKVSDIIERYLNASFAIFAIRQGEEDILRFFKGSEFVDQNQVETHRKLMLDHGKKVIVTGLLEEEEEDLRLFLSDEHIDVLGRLTAESQVEGVGYLLLGEKKSGNPYTPQDTGVVEIVSNELLIAVQNALQFEEIQRFNVTLQEKIDVATRQLKRSNEKLKQLDETKDEFISMASHQLRTPLTSVKGYMSMVLEGDAGKINDNQRKLLSQAFISSQRMVYLIADLLNVSRLKTGKFVIDSIPTNLADVIAGEVQQLKETAAGRNLKLTYKKPADFPILMLDETKTRQVIMNFMDNAIHYTPSGGHITVNLKDKGESIEYTVMDDGIGVPKGEQHHLFTKFYRANNAQKARPDGTGLGLFMAKKVIIAQNGSIIFKSQKDKGSTFGFAFAKGKLPEILEPNTPLDNIAETSSKN